MTFANANGALAATTDTTVYTQSGTQQGSVHTISLSNSTGAAIAVDVKLFSYANATTTTIFDQLSVVKGTPWFLTKALDMMPGDAIILNAGAAGVKYHLSAYVDTTVTATTFNPRGAWSGAATYAALDLVSYAGASWIALQASTNQAPAAGAYWMQNAAQGAQGAAGVNGTNGTGTVNGPAVSTTGNIATYSDTTGKNLGAGLPVGNVANGVPQLDANGCQAMIAEYYTEVAKGAIGAGTVTFTLSAGAAQTLTVTGALTIALAGWPAAGKLAVLFLAIVNGGSAAVTWPTINWMKTDGSGTFTTTFPYTLQSAGKDFALIWSDDGGATYYGRVLR
jgi:hypothetical protein